MAVPAWMTALGNAICTFLRNNIHWMQLLFSLLGVASEILATVWEIKSKKNPLGANIAVAVAFSGLAISGLSYYLMCKLEGIRFRREYWCLPIGRAGNDEYAGSFVGIVGIVFWGVHVAFAIADCIVKNLHDDAKYGLAVFPVLFSGLEVLHAGFMICGIRRSYIIRCQKKFDRTVRPTKLEGCYLINCVSCPNCTYNSGRDGARSWILTPPADAAALEAQPEDHVPEVGAGGIAGAPEVGVEVAADQHGPQVEEDEIEEV